MIHSNSSQRLRLTALVSPSDIRRVKLLAIDRRVSVSAIVRKALHDHFDRRDSGAAQAESEANRG